MSKFNGKWDFVDSENVDTFLKELEINFFMRKALSLMKPSLCILNHKNVWSISIMTAFKNKELFFTEGETFQQTSFGGKIAKFVVNYNGENKLVQDQIIGNRHFQTTRELIDDDLLVQTTSYNGVICKRMYIRDHNFGSTCRMMTTNNKAGLKSEYTTQMRNPELSLLNN